MNRFRSSVKASSSSPSPSAKQQESGPADIYPMEEDLRRRPAPELDLQLISDDARVQFADILGSVPGKKDIVIQQELMSLLDHVTPITFLRK